MKNYKLTQIKKDALVGAAYIARKRAYAPWSGFTVGAALLMRDGRVYLGANYESKLFTQTTHADSAAFIAAGMNGYNTQKDAVAIAVVCPQKNGKPAFPCGNCREDIEELGNKKVHVIAENTLTKKRAEATLEQLLPGSIFQL
ncbi:MAG: cytidine deaminase [Nanoarchaeota archaeon]